MIIHFEEAYDLLHFDMPFRPATAAEKAHPAQGMKNARRPRMQKYATISCSSFSTFRCARFGTDGACRFGQLLRYKARRRLSMRAPIRQVSSDSAGTFIRDYDGIPYYRQNNGPDVGRSLKNAHFISMMLKMNRRRATFGQAYAARSIADALFYAAVPQAAPFRFHFCHDWSPRYLTTYFDIAGARLAAAAGVDAG